MTDALKTMIEISARLGNGQVEYGRFFDMIRSEPEEKYSEFSAEEIVEQVTKRAGLKVLCKSGGET